MSTKKMSKGEIAVRFAELCDLANDKNREGIRTAAWNVLLRAHSMEKDDRVLEALKVGQVGLNRNVLCPCICLF